MISAVMYATLTQGIRIANNILADLAGNHATKLTPQSKDAFAKVLGSLLDLQTEISAEKIEPSPAFKKSI